MALSRRELNAARRGRRAARGQFGPDIRPLRSNSATAVPGQPRGDAAERGSVLSGICQDTGMREHERPRANTNTRAKDNGMATWWKPRGSVAFDWRPAQSRDERWTPQGAHHASQPRKTPAVHVVDNARPSMTMPIGMTSWEK
jgi:hypothetical protein